MDSIPQDKTCKKCGLVFPLTAFPQNKETRDKLSPWCRECHHAANKKSAIVNAVKRAAYRRNTRRKRNPQELLVAKEQSRKWRTDNPDKAKEVRRRYCNKPATKAMKKIEAAHRRLGRIGPRPKKEMILSKYQTQRAKCYWCLKPLGKVYHLDHVNPISRGGTNDVSNLVLACPSCNLSRGNKLPHEWPDGNRLI